MGLSNAEHQAAWRARQSSRVRALESELDELRAELAGERAEVAGERAEVARLAGLLAARVVADERVPPGVALMPQAPDPDGSPRDPVVVTGLGYDEPAEPEKRDDGHKPGCRGPVRLDNDQCGGCGAFPDWEG